jgi:multidrug resistance efflux pump
MLAGYTAALIGFPAVDAPGTVFDVALARVEEITLGIVCATVIHSVVLPQSFEETKLPGISLGDPVSVSLMGTKQQLSGHVDSFAQGIADRDRNTAGNLLPNVNPTFNWVRLAQRIPVRIALDRVPEGVRLVSEQTVTVDVHHRQDARVAAR